jgi:predicted glycosyltransferase
MRKFALYWHNGRALGHTSISTCIGEALLKALPGCTVIGITGASHGSDLMPRGMDYIKLPSYLSFEKKFFTTRKPLSSISLQELFTLRVNIIHNFVHNYSPDVFIIDHNPEGSHQELISTVTDTPSIKKILTLRGVLDNPAKTNRKYFNPQITDYLRDNFSKIFILMDPKIFRIEGYYDIPSSIQDLITYTGYVARQVNLTRLQAKKKLGLPLDKSIIVISFGGGQNMTKVWITILKSLEYLDKDHLVYLIAGPYLDNHTYRYLEKEVFNRSNWKLFRFLPFFQIWMKASDLFIGAGGYNTLAEIISNNINAIIIPRSISKGEQLIHADLLERIGVIRIAKITNITPKDFSTEILNAIYAPIKPKNSAIITNGAIALVNQI